ncbi:phosphate ABC transporter permease PstA [Candidatus Viridilinea mediisalina]|uniref:Phosphate transport system permease protein PstA n=1 Tax=Candidatus Viridilinea mediisalina TaxID=2024553 RepID=A0A2A6RF82_9CHLR|nr:phosphate ABC transporter permease PstA [Candidatus Viridilinea mediisalina]PDW01603.1 phosphate ABC transporter, permease protein PstA [Candidatus Viridilinea mediisalina]
MISQASNYRRRAIVDQIMRGMAILATIVALIPLFLIIGYVIVRGGSSFSIAFFTEAYRAPIALGDDIRSPGGVLHGIVGTILITGLATLIAMPVGIMAGIFLAEYPSNSVAMTVRFCTDVLSAAPSIIVGVVAYTLIVRTTGAFAGYIGSIALAVLMIPIITRTTEEILKLVPQTVREASMALGAPKWWRTLTVVLPAALGAIVTGVMLAFARAAGETAPLILTVLGNNNLSYNLMAPIAALPLLTYRYTEQPFPVLNDLAWGTALVLTLMVLLVNISVRVATRNRLR